MLSTKRVWVASFALKAYRLADMTSFSVVRGRARASLGQFWPGEVKCCTGQAGKESGPSSSVAGQVIDR